MRARCSWFQPLLVLYLLCQLSGHALAQPTTEERFEDATNLMAEGDDLEAVNLLLALYRDSPDSPLADDALFLAATLQEEKLADPSAARKTYQLLLAHFPDGRSALSAKRRLAALESAMGPDASGAEPLAKFSDILNDFPERKTAKSLQLAAKLVRDYPDWSELYRVQIWMGDTYRRRGDLQEALPHYQAALAGTSSPEGKRQASLGAAEVLILTGAFEKAGTELVTLRSLSDDASALHAVDELDALLAQSRSRSRLLLISKILLGAMALALLLLLWRSCGTFAATFAALRRPPLELVYMLPFALLMTLMAFTGHREIGPAVASISAGGLIITWLCGCALRAERPLTTAHALLCAAAATLATLSLVYFAVYRSALLDLILTTVRFGPE